MTWPVANLGDLIEIHDSRRIPLSSKERANRKGPYPYYGASGIIDNIDAHIFEGRHLLVAEDGENLRSRKTPIAFFADGKFWVNNHAHILTAKEGVADLYYLKSVLDITDISGFITGAAQPKLTQENLRRIPISIPPISTQRKIADILSAYDELIENNTRRIAILEEMAQRLYQEWFVHFRYPGHEDVPLVESELGLIPEGWEVVRLGAFLSALESGSRPKGGIDPLAVDVPSIGAENVIGLGKYDYSKDKFVSRPFFESMKKGHVKQGDVVLYKDGANIGRVSHFDCGFPHAECCVNEHVFILRPDSMETGPWLYFLLARPEINARIRDLNSNAAQPGLNQAKLLEFRVPAPLRNLILRFSEAIAPMVELIFCLALRNRQLGLTRDLLLPNVLEGDSINPKFPESIS